MYRRGSGGIFKVWFRKKSEKPLGKGSRGLEWSIRGGSRSSLGRWLRGRPCCSWRLG